MSIKHHLSEWYKKILTPFFVVGVFLIGVIVVYAINTWNSGYRVYHNNTFVSVQGGNNGSVSRLIKSTCTVGDSIFIPTSGYAEWDGPNWFLKKKPSCVKLGCRTNSECGVGEVCSGYVAPVTTCQWTTSDINTACARSALTWYFGWTKIAQDVCNVLTTNWPVRAKYGILATWSDFGHPWYIFGLQVWWGSSSWESNCYTERSNLCKQLTKYPDSGTFSFSMNPHIASYSLFTNQCWSQSSVVSNYVNGTYKNILSHIECTLPTPSAPVSCSTITSPSVCSASAGCSSIVSTPETIGQCVDSNWKCGPSNWVIQYALPWVRPPTPTHLCSAGNPSPFTWDHTLGPGWFWNCLGLNGGANSHMCEAYEWCQSDDDCSDQQSICVGWVKANYCAGTTYTSAGVWTCNAWFYSQSQCSSYTTQASCVWQVDLWSLGQWDWTRDSCTWIPWGNTTQSCGSIYDSTKCNSVWWNCSWSAGTPVIWKCTIDDSVPPPGCAAWYQPKPILTFYWDGSSCSITQEDPSSCVSDFNYCIDECYCDYAACDRDGPWSNSCNSRKTCNLNCCSTYSKPGTPGTVCDPNQSWY